MRHLIRKAASLIGVDWAILYTIFARVVQAGGGIFTVILIARYLTKNEQGYYYTFGSIVAIQVFFELGLSSIITQFAAHEIAHLKWCDNEQLEGELKHKSRLSSLLHFCIKWFSIIAVFVFVVLLGAGFYFFYRFNRDASINWQIPWVLLAFSTSLMFTIDPLLSFIEGLGNVKQVARIRLCQQCSYLLTVFIILLLGGKLYATAIGSLISFSVILSITCFSSIRKRILNIWTYKNTNWIINYRKEIFPYQWRIALSWISGYFIFQLFNPVLFATDGPVVAGQMGMTLAALNGVNSLSMSWINTKIPLFSSLIAQRNFFSLNRIFKKTLIQTVSVCIIGVLMLLSIVMCLRFYRVPIGDRFLPFLPTLLMGGALVVNQLVFAMAIYLRCHKKEPFLLLSITVGILMAFSTLYLGRNFGIIGITCGYFALTSLVAFPWATNIFFKKKRQWHE